MNIRRGTPISRALALLVAASPLILVVLLFVGWAYGKWTAGGSELSAVEQRRHEAQAKTTQARLYAPLGEDWASYAETEGSGLSQAENADLAATAVRARVAALFAKAKGVVTTIERLPDAEASPEGLQKLRFEVSGLAPEQATPALLSELESEAPLLFVEFLDLSRDPATPKRLKIRVRLSLYRLEKGKA